MRARLLAALAIAALPPSAASAANLLLLGTGHRAQSQPVIPPATGVRFWEHNFPPNLSIVVNQSNTSETDPYSCGSQTILGWNFLAPNGAHFTATTHSGNATLTIGGLTGSGQTIAIGDSVAIKGMTGWPNIAAVPGGGGLSAVDGDYTITVTQATGHGPTDGFTMRYDWSQADALIANWVSHNKYINFLFATVAAQTPQEMNDIANEFTVQYATTSGSPNVTISGLTGTGHQISIGDCVTGGTGLQKCSPTSANNTTYVFNTNKGGALHNLLSNWSSNTDGVYVMSYNASATASGTATVMPKFLDTPPYVLNSGVATITCDPTSANQPDPPPPNYLDDRYNVPHHRFMYDVVQKYGSNPGVAALHFPFSGMESFPMSHFPSACASWAQANLGLTGDAWLARAKTEVDFAATLNSPMQLEFDVNGQWQNPSSGADFITQMSQYITSKGFTTGSNGFNLQPFDAELWGTWCPMCYAEMQSHGNQPSEDYFVTSTLPEAINDHIHSMHLYSYVFQDADTVNAYQGEFQAALAPVAVQGAACRILAGQN